MSGHSVHPLNRHFGRWLTPSPAHGCPQRYPWSRHHLAGAALADAEEVVQRQLGADGGMSLRTKELDESGQLRDTLLELRVRSRKE